MPLQHLTTDILLAIALSFSVVLILFVMVSAAIASILSEERTKIEPSPEKKPKDRTTL